MGTRNDTIRGNTGQTRAPTRDIRAQIRVKKKEEFETYLTRLGENGQGGDRRGRGRKSEAKGIDKNHETTQFGSRAYFGRSPNPISKF